MQKNKLFYCAALYGFLGVAVGAFAAHALKARLPAANLDWIHTGVFYQFIHAIVLLVVSQKTSLTSLQKKSALCFIFGILFFSGSLYLLALTSQKMWGMITPMGGVLFLIGWLLLVFG